MLEQEFINERTETSLYKKIPKRYLADVHVGMAQCMNALADKVHKQEVSCTQHSITWPHYSTTIPTFFSEIFLWRLVSVLF